jgi:uncharacterized GH25 family protein
MAASPIQIEMDSCGADLSGIVLDDQDKPVAGAIVVGIPEPNRRNRPEAYLRTVTNQKGEFSVLSARPGEYTMFALARGNEMVPFDPDFVSDHAADGQTLNARAKEQHKLTLHILPSE